MFQFKNWKLGWLREDTQSPRSEVTRGEQAVLIGDKHVLHCPGADAADAEKALLSLIVLTIVSVAPHSFCLKFERSW